ncbi:allophanate hydrolase subunit 1 [Streptomyces sp. NPDC004783]|uniref:5-oxoprolinase subunit B family protein n=1 Tax=Streptomyces sp. NPDC004783 TaxID=3154459 RepID=UPI0033A5AAD2
MSGTPASTPASPRTDRAPVSTLPAPPLTDRAPVSRPPAPPLTDRAPASSPPAPPRTDPTPALTIRPAGHHALLVELPDAEHTAAFHAELLRRRAAGTLPPVEEIVPGARTVLLDGVPDPEALARRIAGWDIAPGAADDGETVDIPVRYDGPDLSDVAALWNVAPGEVAGLHSSHTYRVAFCGFAPGFGYLTGLPQALHVPRRATPRTRVPAGAVALAGPYSAVYPRSTPGGWQLIGTVPDPGELWDPARERAALLTPGTRVRFVPVPDEEGAA